MLPFKNGNYSNIAIATVVRKSDNFGRAITIEREPSKKKIRIEFKKDAKRIKSDNFTRSNRGMNDWMAT